MKDRIVTYRFFSFCLMLSLFFLSAKSQRLHTIDLKEKFTVITDRSLYAAGEKIYFAVYETGLSDISGEGLSKVLYADLISPDGQIMKSAKFPILNRQVKSAIQIPSDIPSGTWYLRFYSRWLRNYRANDMSYVSVRIVNPSGSDHLSVDTTAGKEYNLYRQEDTEGIDGLTIHSDKRKYKKRENVILTLKNQNVDSLSEFTVKVAPAASLMPQLKNQPDESYIIKSPEFIPEVRELSLSGKVKNLVTGEFEAFAHVFLTLLDKERNFYPGITDSAGNFYFSLPAYTGSHDLFLSVRNTEGDSLSVLIDNDFATGHEPLPSPALELDSAEYELALQIIRNQQLKEQYYPDTSVHFQEGHNNVLFYGEPSRRIEITEYIDLPSLEEYFLELLPMVRIIRSDGTLAFRINGPQAEMNIYDPAVMIDGVVMHINEAVMAIDPQRIRQIDIINQPYLRGDIIFGGIISILSKDNDFAGVDLPGNGLFLTYRFYEPETGAPQAFIPHEKNLPDPRNTLYWNPGLTINQGEEKQLNFLTSDTPGRYIISVTGVKRDGEIVRNTSEITVY